MASKTSRTTKTTLLLLAAAAAATLPACTNTSRHAGNESAVRWSPTPELITRHERSQDSLNSWAYYVNTQNRSIAPDASRALYIDRPSRLFHGPKPY